MSTLLSHYENHARHRYSRSKLFSLIREVVKRSNPNYGAKSAEILTIAHYSYSMNQGCFKFATLWRFEHHPKTAEEQIVAWMDQLQSFTLARYNKYYETTHKVTI